MHHKTVWRQVCSHVRLRIALLGLLLTLIAESGVNAQVYPNCVAGQSCSREFVFPWIPVGNQFTARVTFLDNLPNDQSGTTPAVAWWLTWHNLTPDGVVQWQSSVSVSENGGTASTEQIVFLAQQCTTNGCTDTLDLLAPVCAYQDPTSTNCPSGGPPPPEMDLAVEGMAQVDASPNDQYGNPVPNGLLSLTPPSVHVMYWNGATNTVSWDDTYPAVWIDQAYPSWHAPVVVGGGGQPGWFKDCAFAVVNMDPTGAGTTITVSLQDVAGNVIDQETIPIMSQQYQNTAYECSAFFPNEANLPKDKGTNANLVFRASQPIIPFVNQVLGGGGLGGNIASVTVFQDVTQVGPIQPLPQPPPAQ